MATTTLSAKHIIVGLGKTGIACLRFLTQQSVSVAVVDTRTNPPFRKTLLSDFPHVPYSLGKLPHDWFKGADTLTISPGINPAQHSVLQAALTRGITLLNDVDLFAKHTNATPIIAITGSNGKSSVTQLVGRMLIDSGLRVKIGGNLGTPVLELLDTKQTTEAFVIELSSFQLADTHYLKPQIATCLNITPDHLDRHGSLTHYIKAKQRIFSQAKKAVINRQDPITTTGVQLPSDTISFGLDKPPTGQFGLSNDKNNTFLAYGETLLMPVQSLKLQAAHQVTNALAALAIGHSFGLTHNTMLKTLTQFTGLPHRCELITTYDNVSWYNDSKATNVGAAVAAIKGLGNQYHQASLIVIAGGQAKVHDDFSLLIAPIKQHVKQLILMGQDRNKLYKTLGNTVNTSQVDNLTEAVKQAFTYAQPGDTVLLTPACSSFDHYQNFEQRGNAFAQLVQQLIKQQTSQ